MIATAMLNWFDEPPELLRQAVRSAAVICDRIVVADGAYELVPDKQASSPPAQRKAIASEAKKCGLEVEFPEPKIYAGQVTKRTATLQQAKEGSDWVVVLDADWKIEGDREAIREELELYHSNGYEQVLVDFFTPDDPSRDWETKAANEWHKRMAGNFEQHAFIYRCFPVMAYAENHWSLYVEDADGRKLVLCGADNGERPKTTRLRADHLFTHQCLFRKSKQILRNRSYIALRDPAAELAGFET